MGRGGGLVHPTQPEIEVAGCEPGHPPDVTKALHLVGGYGDRLPALGNVRRTCPANLIFPPALVAQYSELHAPAYCWFLPGFDYATV